ncbi:MAG: hypothetical protein B5M54_06010 [Candidatus Aminicenantes bacterium 4484_214]|nr:MAG: hypothetical protein B5M54_06010 [Candidatus Aminicenantes bacterium 4484_214]RLE10758.1 MAG: hypothetical protein DRJ06_00725 [Candidatus Aminicenantes bacterium]
MFLIIVNLIISSILYQEIEISYSRPAEKYPASVLVLFWSCLLDFFSLPFGLVYDLNFFLEYVKIIPYLSLNY